MDYRHDFLIKVYRSNEVNGGSKFIVVDTVFVESFLLLLNFFTSLFDFGIAIIPGFNFTPASFAAV